MEKIEKLRADIRDAAAFYGDTCAEPELWGDDDRARAHLYLRMKLKDLRKALFNAGKPTNQ
jgi:hypothetical protein